MFQLIGICILLIGCYAVFKVVVKGLVNLIDSRIEQKIKDRL